MFEFLKGTFGVIIMLSIFAFIVKKYQDSKTKEENNNKDQNAGE